MARAQYWIKFFTRDIHTFTAFIYTGYCYKMEWVLSVFNCNKNLYFFIVLVDIHVLLNIFKYSYNRFDIEYYAIN